MKKLFALSLAAFAVGCGPYEPVALSADEEMELAEELRGRVAEQPVNCVSQRDLGGNRSIGEEVILFGSRGSNVIYVNRPLAGCPAVSSSRALITRTPSTQLCRGDIVQVVDLVSRFDYGGCTLGEFTPYRKVD